ncbi:MAG: N-acetylmuramoyl-L-alanine amidase [Jatrophihabitantaceae bacterium]
MPAAPRTGTVIVLNPGHNGANAANAAAINRQVPAGFGQYKACDTTGTETNAGYPEYAFNWDVSLRVKALLQARGITVIMTRGSDTGVGPCVDERARIGNQAGVRAVISIHADGAATSGHGFHVCEDSRQPAGPAVAAASHRLTVAMHDALLSGSGMSVSSYLGSNGYFPRDDLAGLNLATVPATFLEIGNMRNAGDAAIQSSAAGRQRIAQALAAGILAWL